MTDSISTGLVIRSTGNRAIVLIDGEQLEVAIPGKWRRKAKSSKPMAPGDKLILERVGDDFVPMERVERTNHFTRRQPGPREIPQTLAANLDMALVFASLNNPKTALGLIDRLLLAADVGGVPTALIVNKIDIAEGADVDNIKRIYKHAVDVLLTVSALTGENVEEVKKLTQGKTVLLTGQSGVGKSTLVNHISPGLDIKTGSVSDYSGKGKHVTSASQMYATSSGGWIIDTPGLRECAPWATEPADVARAFPEAAKWADGCKFRDCIHVGEHKCAVKPHVGSDEFPQERYDSYVKLAGQAREKRSEW